MSRFLLLVGLFSRILRGILRLSIIYSTPFTLGLKRWPQTWRRPTGTPKRWKPIAPAMAAGMTDHVWTTTELLSYRVPAQFSDQLSKIKPLFALPDEVHQGK